MPKHRPTSPNCTGGAGLTQDLKEAARWYRKAAMQSHATAQVNLGAMYQDGLGVVQDLVMAYVWMHDPNLFQAVAKAAFPAEAVCRWPPFIPGHQRGRCAVLPRLSNPSPKPVRSTSNRDDVKQISDRRAMRTFTQVALPSTPRQIPIWISRMGRRLNRMLVRGAFSIDAL